MMIQIQNNPMPNPAPSLPRPSRLRRPWPRRVAELCRQAWFRLQMNSYSKVVGISLLITLLLPACSTDPRRDLAKFKVDDVRREEAGYRAAAMEFVKAAQDGKVEDMLRLTSALTLTNSGAAVVRTVYVEQVVPQLKGAEVRWDSGGEVLLDDTYNVGFQFSGKVIRADKSFPIYIIIMKEGGKFAVINFRKTRKQER